MKQFRKLKKKVPSSEKSGIIHQREGDFGEIRLHLRKQGSQGLLVINASRILNLNATATFYIERILEGQGDTEIIQELQKTYKVSHEQASQDL